MYGQISAPRSGLPEYWMTYNRPAAVTVGSVRRLGQLGCVCVASGSVTLQFGKGLGLRLNPTVRKARAADEEGEERQNFLQSDMCVSLQAIGNFSANHVLTVVQHGRTHINVPLCAGSTPR